MGKKIEGGWIEGNEKRLEEPYFILFIINRPFNTNSALHRKHKYFKNPKEFEVLKKEMI